MTNFECFWWKIRRVLLNIMIGCSTESAAEWRLVLPTQHSVADIRNVQIRLRNRHAGFVCLIQQSPISLWTVKLNGYFTLTLFWLFIWARWSFCFSFSLLAIIICLLSSYKLTGNICLTMKFINIEAILCKQFSNISLSLTFGGFNRCFFRHSIGLFISCELLFDFLTLFYLFHKNFLGNNHYYYLEIVNSSMK